ncbi:putative protein FAR1-RELATED SEQUENCE 10 [Lycium ferocissimum]|uniref:putative protein FAR1-RELATED SEQUENCE 10 n=1 Tax=Lycium ferocissimum TaxID=112874 RepID=UPI002814DF44|nr:putative protein FAR1-RELATED SEQUENCE 10 [Lycium ferocissimum]
MDSTVGVLRSHCPYGDNGCHVNEDIVVGSTEISNEELRHENIDISNGDLHKGKVFNSDDEAYNCYVNFAKKVGFLIRRDRILGSEEHPMGIYKTDYVCHRAGSPHSQKIAENERQRDRKSSRCNCNAKMFIAKDMIDGIPHWVRFLPAYRNIDIIDQKRITLLAKKSRLLTSLIRRVLELEKGVNVGQLPFTEKDIKNFLQSKSSTNTEYDALELLKVCKSLKDKDVDFQYDFTVDTCQRLEHIIWAFGDSIHAYELFGDVVVFYTTYQLNRYEMPPGV